VLDAFKIGHGDINVTTGPTVTRFEFPVNFGTRASRLRNLKDEIAMALHVQSVRIIAPTENGNIGIEVPNTDRQTISITSMFYSDEYLNNDMQLPICLGRKVDNSVLMADLATMPHLLVAGATGMGK
jgi:S-DNA-T family DNA segregation ATPase FtsK/SpoIIIE